MMFESKIFLSELEADRDFYELEEKNYKIEFRSDANGILVIYKWEYPGGTTHWHFRVNSLADVRATPNEMECLLNKGEA